jgi:hypothetical protein
VANLTAKALRNAHRFERLQQRRGEGGEVRQREQEHAALLAFMRRLLSRYPLPSGEVEESGGRSAELERLAEVAEAVLGQESASR